MGPPPPPGSLPTKRGDDAGMSSEDDGLPRSPPEMSLLHDIDSGTTIKASATCAPRLPPFPPPLPPPPPPLPPSPPPLSPPPPLLSPPPPPLPPSPPPTCTQGHRGSGGSCVCSSEIPVMTPAQCARRDSSQLTGTHCPSLGCIYFHSLSRISGLVQGYGLGNIFLGGYRS